VDVGHCLSNHNFNHSILKALIDLLRAMLLRGILRRWWIIRRGRQLENAYLAALTDEAGSAVGHGDSKTPFSTGTTSFVHRLLYIGDCMWEHEQLFPEIRKICDLEFLDLHADILCDPDPALAVVKALRDLAASRCEPDPDLIIFYLRPSLLSEEAFDIIRKRWSCPLLGMNLDDRVEFYPYGILRSGNDNYARWIRSFDVNLTSSLTSVDWYRDRGAEVRHFPQGFHPDHRFLNPPDKIDFEHSFSFVGSWKPERDDLVKLLEKNGIRPTVFGSGWRQAQWATDPQAIYRTSQINLGIGYALASARIANAKGRDIECPAVGACYLTTYHWEISDMFEIGKEVLCYRNAEELVEIYSYYSKRPMACLAVARAAHKRAHAQHTWEMRLRALFHDLGFKPAPR